MDEYLGSVIGIQRSGDGDGAAIGIDHGGMGGFKTFEGGPEVAGEHGVANGSPGRIEVGHAFFQIDGVHERVHRNIVVIGIAQVLGAVGVDAAFGLHDEVDGFFRLESPLGQRVGFY